MTQASLQPGLNQGDAENLAILWKGMPSPQAIITSPPYLDMHDYGNSSRIGSPGQSVADYLEKMAELLLKCYQIAAADATLWLVAGGVRRNGRLIPLPDRLAQCAERVGWILRESITWDKQKALPWTHHGEFRDITEQALLFSKADYFRFDPAELRSPIPNSVWWRRYPERYSPDGAMPTNLWTIPIPTQGSWAGVHTHVCPFPEELTYRMISLTTVEGEVVLDPLAGIGSVPAMAEAMGRIGYGIELTAHYTTWYERTRRSARTFVAQMLENEDRRQDFRRTIIELRLLKFGRLLAKQLHSAGFPVLWVRTTKAKGEPIRRNHVVAGEFRLVVDSESMAEVTLAAARGAVGRPPLSKFGVEARLSAERAEGSSRDGYWYQSGKFWTTPHTEPPTGGEPHVVAEFVPDPDQIDDTPYL